MHVRTSRQAQVGGFIVLAAILLTLVLLYVPRATFAAPHFWETILAVAATIAIMSVTTTMFFLWDNPLSHKMEEWFGPVGHVIHCGYCHSLWLSAGATTLLGLAFFPSLPPVVDFFFSWWALGAFVILFNEILSIGWFQKIEMVRQRHERTAAYNAAQDLTNAKDSR